MFQSVAHSIKHRLWFSSAKSYVLGQSGKMLISRYASFEQCQKLQWQAAFCGKTCSMNKSNMWVLAKSCCGRHKNHRNPSPSGMRNHEKPSTFHCLYFQTAAKGSEWYKGFIISLKTDNGLPVSLTISTFQHLRSVQAVWWYDSRIRQERGGSFMNTSNDMIYQCKSYFFVIFAVFYCSSYFVPPKKVEQFKQVKQSKTENK